MTAATQSAAKASVRANNPADDGRHAYASEGQIMVMDGGRFQPMTRWQAVGVLSELNDALSPIGQERARQIRAVLKETMQ